MLSLAERQNGFAQALLDASEPVPMGLDGPAGTARAERFAVYRNNVAVGLIEALRSAFPVTDQLVGSEFFTVMAHAHALESPPASPVLLHYGGDFPAFVARFEPAAALPYLSELAALEWLWLESYHEADEAALAIEALGAVAPSRLPGLRLGLHPAVRFAAFDHPALSIWQFHQNGGGEGELTVDAGPEWVLIARPEAAVSVSSLSRGGFALVAALAAGETIAEAADAGASIDPNLDFGDLLPRLFAAGAIASFHDDETSRGETE